eukprot:TRINITY_DN225_c0_g1_i3.p1 TRINITY_DN225_c0_g1~~TRINITY_DN225_c0_g1_i3.p1  ORF type:complete len:751 (-),score=176.52 TRINITY_DN225_c0_g1_i3:500-2752(-)
MAQPPGYIPAPVVPPLPPGNHINPAPIYDNATTAAKRYHYPAIILGTEDMLVRKMHIDADVHVSVGFVTVSATYYNHTGKGGDCMLYLPMNQYATIVSAQVTIGNRVIETQVISQEDAIKYSSKSKNKELEEKIDDSYETYSPEVFRLPIRNIQPGDTLYLSANYFENLLYVSGKYSCSVPMSIPDYALPSDQELNQILSFDITLNSPLGSPQLSVENHPVKTVVEQAGKVSVRGRKEDPWHNKDISFSYPGYSPEISASALIEKPDPMSGDPRSSFLLFVSPPQNAKTIGSYGRSVVFLIDQSGSMAGDPMEQAKRALLFGLTQLQPQDFFSIIAFDDQQDYFSTSLMPATPSNIDSAKVWVSNLKARGLTDIMTPLCAALKILTITNSTIPFIFMITDGAVSDERAICKYVLECRTPTRICTFGIGTYCNAYFLKMLSILGRGFSDVGLNPDLIYPQIVRMLEMAQTPALTDIEIGMRTSHCEVYPFPVPDLFIGAPLVVSGKYYGTPLDNMLLKGDMPGGNVWSQTIKTSSTHDIPISKVFVKLRLDLLTAKTWLSADDKLRQEIIDLSIQESMPCAYTSMVAYETTVEKKNAMAENGATQVEKGKKVNRNALVAGLAVGGVVVLGAAAMHFGNLAASLGNMSVLGSLADVGLGSLGDGIAGAGGTMLNGLGEAGSVVLEGLQGLGAGVGNFGAALGDVLEGGATCCGEACGSVCGEAGVACGDCCMQCVEVCGDIIGAIIEGGLAA